MAHNWQDPPYAEAGGAAVILEAEIFLHRAGVDEQHAAQHVAVEREGVFRADQQHEVAADGLVGSLASRAYAAILKAADRPAAAAVERLEDGCVAEYLPGGDPAGEDVLAVQGVLEQRAVVAIVAGEPPEVPVAEYLFVADDEAVAGGGIPAVVRPVARECELRADQQVAALGIADFRWCVNVQIGNFNVLEAGSDLSVPLVFKPTPEAGDIAEAALW